MTVDARAMVDRLYEALSRHDAKAVVELYADDAVVVRHDGAVEGRDAIQGFWERYLDHNRPYELDHIVAFRHEHDIALWDAMITTEAGKLLTYDVAVLDDSGAITRHVPLIRGYWGL